MKKHFALAAWIITFSFSSANSQTFSLVKDMAPGIYGSWPNKFHEYSGKLFFAAADSGVGYHLWMTDGTETGTEKIKDIDLSYTYGFAEYNGKLFFNASDNTGNENELWTSDGTTAGTYLLKNINSSPFAGSYPGGFIEYNGKLFFTAIDTIGFPLTRHLWYTDGTSQGTLRTDLSNIILAPYLVYNNKIVCLGRDSDQNNTGLYSTDGTKAGTSQIKIVDGINIPVIYNSKMYFSIYTSQPYTPDQLWVSDGTEMGTQLLKDSSVGILSVFDNQLFFIHDDGVHGYEPWAYDGSNFHLLKDINPNGDGWGSGGFDDGNGHLYFSADNGATGLEPWITDGTDSGTHLLKDIFPGIDPGYNLSSFALCNSRIYFVADKDNQHSDLYETDGTSVGTVLIEPPGASPYYDHLAFSNSLYSFQNSVYFAAIYFGYIGNELWKYTPASTGISENISKFNLKIYPNPFSSSINISFTLQKNSGVSLEVLNLLGQKVKTILRNENQSPGSHQYTFTSPCEGIYYMKLTVDGISSSQKIICQK